MTTAQYLAALRKLKLLPTSKAASEALGVSIRQLIRYKQGDAVIPPTLERLLACLVAIAQSQRS